MFGVIVTEKGGAQQRHEFDEEMITIGRVQGNDIVLARGNVSKRHARIELKGGELVLVDLGSTNGTYVNGRRVADPVTIGRGDKIYLGDYILTLEPPEPEAEVQSASGGVHRVEPVVTPAVAVAQPAAPKAQPPRPQVPRPAPAARPPVEVSLPRPVSARAAEHPFVEPPSPAETARARQEQSQPAMRLPDPSAAEELAVQIESLLGEVARQVKRIDRATVPCKVDPGTAGKVRIVIQDLVGELAGRGRLSPRLSPEVLIGRTFRTAVDVGPLAGWLDDPGVEAVRCEGPDEVQILRDGSWSDAPVGFVSAADLGEALSCLAAGLECRDEGVPGLSRFRLEEGHLMLAALPPTASGPSFLLRKADLAVGGASPWSRAVSIEPAAQSVLIEAIGQRRSLAVVGPSSLARLVIVDHLARLLPAGELCVAVEKMPLTAVAGRHRLSLHAGSVNAEHREVLEMRPLLSRATDLEPTWLVAVGATPDDLPALISTATGRRGFLGELPLTGERAIDVELAATCTAAGTTLDPRQAAGFLAAGFDLLCFCRRDDRGRVVVDRLVEPRLDAEGRLAPVSRFEIRKR